MVPKAWYQNHSFENLLCNYLTLNIFCDISVIRLCFIYRVRADIPNLTPGLSKIFICSFFSSSLKNCTYQVYLKETDFSSRTCLRSRPWRAHTYIYSRYCSSQVVIISSSPPTKFANVTKMLFVAINVLIFFIAHHHIETSLLKMASNFQREREQLLHQLLVITYSH